MQQIDRTEFVKLLIEERNFHFNHPHEIIRKMIFSVGSTFTTIFIALFIKKYDEQIDLIVLLKSWKIYIPLMIILFGYLFILWGISEHSHIHREQRKRITKAIDFLLNLKDEEYNFNKFWKRFGLAQLTYRKNKKISSDISLFAKEPDRRDWINFHDRKIEIGILIIIIGFAGLLYILIKCI